MTKSKNAGWTMLIIGLLLLLATFTVDIIGIGSSPEFGWKQWIGTIVGLVLTIGGGYIIRKS